MEHNDFKKKYLIKGPAHPELFPSIFIILFNLSNHIYYVEDFSFN